MVNQVINKYLKDYVTYFQDNWYWVINPDTKEWAICVSETGYTFFNKDFWNNFSLFYPPIDLDKDIQTWVLSKIDVPKSKHCYPDYIVGDYDWRDEFEEELIRDVITNGILYNM